MMYLGKWKKNLHTDQKAALQEKKEGGKKEDGGGGEEKKNRTTLIRSQRLAGDKFTSLSRI